jgi:hypothetical protein
MRPATKGGEDEKGEQARYAARLLPTTRKRITRALRSLKNVVSGRGAKPTMLGIARLAPPSAERELAERRALGHRVRLGAGHTTTHEA